MNVLLYNFSKRKNSTKQPDPTTATTISCQLKETTSVISPVLQFNPATTGFSTPFNPSQFNYAHLPLFSRYYFITDWVWLNGLWECQLAVDVLASYKLPIGALSEYVVRSSAAKNGEIIDNLYPATCEIRTSNTLISTPFVRSYGGGYYIIGIISNDSASAQGAVSYYQMTAGQVATLKSYMMSESFLSEQGLTAQDVVEVLPKELLKTLYNPFQYIASCEWFPLAASAIDGAFKSLDNNIQFGWWRPASNVSGYKVSSSVPVYHYTDRISVNGHPQRFDRGVYLDHTPYTQRTLYFEPFGSIPLNDESLIGGDFLRVEIDVDCVLGDAVMSLYHDRPVGDGTYTNMGLIYRSGTKVSIPIQLAQTTIDIEAMPMAAAVNGGGQLASGIMGMVKNGFSFSALGDTFNSALGAVADTAANPVGQLQTSGSNGSLARFAQNSYYVCQYRIVVDDDNSQKGSPLCEVRRLNTLGGYMVIDTPDVNISALDPERVQIIGFLSGGFFYE